MATTDIICTLRFGPRQASNVPFTQAAKFLENCITIERSSCNDFVNKFNRDHWLTSFWSEVFGGVKPPSQDEWHRPITILNQARQAYKIYCSKYAQSTLHDTYRPKIMDGQQNTISKFRHAMEEFNKVHKKWVTYRDGLHKGGKTAITIMELTISSLAAGAGGAAATTFRTGVAAAGSFKAIEASGKAVGMWGYGIEDKVDLSKILLQVGEEIAKSIAGGVLGEKFLRILAPRLSATWRLDRSILPSLTKAGVGTKVQKLFSGFISSIGVNTVTNIIKATAKKAKGRKDLTMEQFLELVADEMVKQIAPSNMAKQSWTDFCKEYATRYIR